MCRIVVDKCNVSSSLDLDLKFAYLMTSLEYVLLSARIYRLSQYTFLVNSMFLSSRPFRLVEASSLQYSLMYDITDGPLLPFVCACVS